MRPGAVARAAGRVDYRGMQAGSFDDARNVLVVPPNWVGDVVLATPALAAIRARFAAARVTFLMRAPLAEVVAGGGWNDDAVFWPGSGRLGSTIGLGRDLGARRFDLAVLMPNSFRAALVCRLAGIPRRVGYARDGRGWLLTDRLHAPKRDGVFTPTPMTPYYAELSRHVGAPVVDQRPRLGVTPEQEQAGRALLVHYGLDGGRPYAVLNPGAAFGASKCWLPARFAELADRLHAELGLPSVIVGATGEVPLMRDIARRASSAVICCDSPGTTLGTLKVVIREAALLVCNDTGPRHYGNAFGTPTVTIFGPTNPAWTSGDYPAETCLQVAVDCGPCQLPRCPLDHRCMVEMTTERVFVAAHDALLRRGARLATDGPSRPPGGATGELLLKGEDAAP